MELVLTDNIIESINKVKKNQFTYENAFLLLKKYDDEKLNDYKKLRPILMKMREIDNGNQSSEEEESEAIKILHE